jgi:hypothetical protein
MKAQLAKIVKSEFRSWMRARFPDFQKVGTAFGGVIYRKGLPDGTSVFCFLLPHTKLDRFTLELAVSDELAYPFDILPGTSKENVKRRIRINSLIPSGDRGWWNTNSSHEPDLSRILQTWDPDEIAKAEKLVPGLVADAVEQLAKALFIFMDQIGGEVAQL